MVIQMRLFRFGIMIIHIVLAFQVCLGCEASRPDSGVPEDFVEDLMLASVTRDWEWNYDNTYTYPNMSRAQRRANPAIFTENQREYVRELLDGECKFQAEYNGNRARLFVDITDSEFVPWYNVNIRGEPPEYWHSMYDSAFASKIFYVIYHDGRWWIDTRGVLHFRVLAEPE